MRMERLSRLDAAPYNGCERRNMKTMLVVAEKSVNKHVGEEYDVILEVESQPTTATIQDWASRMKDGIRALWHEQAGDAGAKVVVTLDAASPFHAVLLNLRVIMKAEEGVVVELPYMTPEMEARVEGDVIEDREAQELLKKLGKG